MTTTPPAPCPACPTLHREIRRLRAELAKALAATPKPEISDRQARRDAIRNGLLLG